MTSHTPRVVIVGGGFGGLNAARRLSRAPVSVVLIDRRNHHLFQPLLYQVATAALSPSQIASPIRGILSSQNNVRVVLGEVVAVDKTSREVRLGDGQQIAYDYLIVATGAVDQYFGHPEWAEFAPGLKNIDDATEIRRRFLLAFEAAEREPDLDRRRTLLTTVVVGGGPTGVEMAGAMAEVTRHTLSEDFREIDPSTSRIILVEGGDRLLAGYSSSSSREAERQLQKRGVEVRLNSMVTGIDADAVFIGDDRIEARNVVWAAGVGGSELGRVLTSEVDWMGRVRVNDDLSIPGHPEIFVIGDLTSLDGPDGEPLPGVAPVAIQQGKTVARNIRRELAGEVRRPFRYFDKGMMATIGRGDAIAEFAGIRLAGVLAWLAWLFVHVLFLIGFRNRVAVMLEWAYSYITWERGSRLITGPIGLRLDPPNEPIGRGRRGADATTAGRDRAEGVNPSVEREWVAGDAGRLAEE